MKRAADNEVVLARCKVALVKETAGSPFDCLAISSLRESGVFVRVERAYTLTRERGRGLPDLSIRVIGTRVQDQATMIAAVENALRRTPLLLEAQVLRSGLRRAPAHDQQPKTLIANHINPRRWGRRRA